MTRSNLGISCIPGVPVDFDDIGNVSSFTDGAPAILYNADNRSERMIEHGDSLRFENSYGQGPQRQTCVRAGTDHFTETVGDYVAGLYEREVHWGGERG